MIILTVEILATLAFATVALVYQAGIRSATRAERPHMAAAYRIERNGWLTLTVIAFTVVILTITAYALDSHAGA